MKEFITTQFVSNLLLVAIIAASVLVVSVVFADDFTSSNFTVVDPVLEGGGGFSTSTNFQLQGTIPYISTAISSSTNFISIPGFEAYTTSTATLPVVTATAGTESADISWTAASGAGSPFTYQVGLSTTAGGPYSFEAAQSGTTLTKTGLSAGLTYYVVVRTLDSGSNSVGLSAQVSVVPTAAAVTPTNNNAGGGGGGGFPFRLPAENPVIEEGTNVDVGVSTPVSDADTDSDGVPDYIECPISGFCPDTDNDGVPNFADVDDDNDTIPTIIESYLNDTDGDSIPDYLDPSSGTGETNTAPPQDIAVPVPFTGSWALIPPQPLQELLSVELPPELVALLNFYDNNLLNNLVPYFDDGGFLGVTIDTPPGYNATFSLPVRRSPNYADATDQYTAGLSLADKATLPSNVLFMRAGEGFIDLLSGAPLVRGFNNNRRIEVLANRILHLSLKPTRRPAKMAGYVVYDVGRNRMPVSELGIPEAFAQAGLQNGFVVSQFGYEDEDGDGIYAAKLSVPPVPGQYTMVTYIEDANGVRSVYSAPMRVIAEGLVRTKDIFGRQVGVSGALVTLEYIAPDAQDFSAWDGTKFNELNPRLTDEEGKYSFVVPEAIYRLRVTKDGYHEYIGSSFVMEGRSGINHIVELTRVGRLSVLDLMNFLYLFLIFITPLLLAYVYLTHEKRREDAEQYV